ncbi:MAG TPA: S8 family serine peptidase [Thermomicrobiales bacterium]|nr:S8 family serine peptidase [Thermomicrobiales bacterium]
MARISRVLTIGLIVVLAFAGVATLVQPRAAIAKGGPHGKVPDQYIVRLKPDVDSASKLDKLKRGGNVSSRHLYRHAFNGFAVRMSADKAEALRADPDVLSVVPDFYISATAETVPSGIQRTDADLNAFTNINREAAGVTVDAGVAIVDTGIDLDHPDLNVVNGVNCAIDGTSPDDLNGHGTHVAGTVGALDNDLGVVGIAPGVRLYAVRVLSAAGEGEFSNAICGLEWVLDHAGEIDVVNMSFGGEAPEGDCNDGSLHEVVCDVIAAGISVVVAAGNGGSDMLGDDAAGFAPANFDEVITVSAIVDTDGQPGGDGAGNFFWGPDDSIARFSNWGADVDIAAPGVDIYSTWPNGYQASDGTSMASPHVAGAAALVHAMNAGISPGEVRDEILAVAWPQASPEGFSGDSDGFAEPLLNVGALGGDPLLPLPPPPPPPSGCTIDTQSGPPGTIASLACAGFNPGELASITWDTPSGTFLGLFFTDSAGSGSASPRIPSTSPGAHNIIVIGNSSGTLATIPFTVVSSVKVTPDPLTAGKSAQIRLAGFLAGEQVAITWTDGTASVALPVITAGSNGTASKAVTVPFTPQGTYTVIATGATSGEVASVFVTVAPSLVASPTSARVGSKITLTLSAFMPDEQVTINWYDADVVTPIGSITASSVGSATISFNAPETIGGDHLVEAVGDQGTVVARNVKITPRVQVSPTGIKVGEPMTVDLTGYGPNEVVTIDWYTTTSEYVQIGAVTVGPNGSGTLTTPVPDATYGSHRVRGASATSGPNIYATASIRANVVLSPVTGSSGDQVTATATGFKAGESVSIRWYRTASAYVDLTSAPVSATGSGTVTFMVPDSQTLGNHKVIGYGGTSRLQAITTFTVQ